MADAEPDRDEIADTRPAAGGAGASGADKGPIGASGGPDGSVPVLAAAVQPSGDIPTPDKGWAADLARDPSPLVGKSAEQVAAEFRAHGFEATVEQSTRGSGRAQLVRVEKSPVSVVEIHPGEGSHGGAYTKVSTDGGKSKYVDPDTYVRRSPEPKTKFFDATTGAPIDEASLPLRGSGGQSGTKPPDPPASGPDSPGPAPSGGVRPPPPGGSGGGGQGTAGAVEQAAKDTGVVHAPLSGGSGGGQAGAGAVEQGAKNAGAVRGATGALTEAVSKTGKVLAPVAVAADVVQLGQAVQQDGGRVGDNTGRTASGVAASWGGAAVGAKGGAVVGAAIGSVVPGVGTAVGAVVGGLVGAVTGGIGGDWVGRHGYDWVKSWF